MGVAYICGCVLYRYIVPGHLAHPGHSKAMNIIRSLAFAKQKVYNVFIKTVSEFMCLFPGGIDGFEQSIIGSTGKRENIV